jgi:hypothetical protein
MFGANPKRSRNLHVLVEAEVVTEGKDPKTSDKGAMMMFVGHAE